MKWIGKNKNTKIWLPLVWVVLMIVISHVCPNWLIIIPCIGIMVGMLCHWHGCREVGREEDHGVLNEMDW